MYDPLFRLCLLRTQTAWRTNTCSLELQGAKTTTLVLWAPILALTVVVFGSYWIVPGLAVFAGPHASRRRFPPVEVFGIPGRDYVGRKEVRFPAIRSKFGGDHSQRGRFQGGGNGALESTRAKVASMKLTMRIASGLRAPNPKPSSGASQRPSGTISRIIAGSS